VWTKLVTLPELQAMSDNEVIQSINKLLVPSTSALAQLDSGDVVAAQFYLAELRRREDQRAKAESDRIETERWRIDQRNEYIIIALIGIEILLAIGLAIWGDRRQTRDVQQQLEAFGRMQTVLSHLEASSQATADTLKNLQTTTEGMNTALQKQLALSYDVSISVFYNQEKKRMNFINMGHTNVTLWGLKFFDEPKIIEPPGRTIQPNGAGYEIEAAPMYGRALARIPKGQTGLAPFEIYLKNERGEEFVEYCFFGVSWDAENLKLAPQVASITPEHWSKTKAVKAGAERAPLANP
jgi:hypothetical protein